MEAKVSIIGVLAACITTMLLPLGCQPSDGTVTTQACETCPVCTKETRVQPITGLEYTTCICPTCREVSPLSEDVVRGLERFTGGPVGGTVHVCGACEAVVTECAACRQSRG